MASVVAEQEPTITVGRMQFLPEATDREKKMFPRRHRITTKGSMTWKVPSQSGVQKCGKTTPNC